MFGKLTSHGRQSASGERFSTLVGEHTTIRGDLDLSEGIRIDGQIQGHLRRRSEDKVTVVVGPSGKVTGDIEATRVVIAGTVHGSVRADEDVDLEQTAVIEGDVHCKSLQVAHGARLLGRILTGELPATHGKPVLVLDARDASKAA